MIYSFEDPKNHQRVIEVPRQTKDKIIKDYLVKTYYWSIAFSCLIIGFLLGLLAN